MRVLVVDDEPVARRGLHRQLDRLPGVTCVGECGGKKEAVEAIVERAPDVVLLDIQLGRGTAFDIIEEVGAEAMPLVVFVTAYDRHALKAFEVHALDYVLKPVDPDRLGEALDRAVSVLALRRGPSLAERLEGLLADHAGPPSDTPVAAPAPMPDRLVVREGERLSFVDAASVDWIQSAGNYVRLHCGERQHLMRTTMDRVTRRLSTGGAFVRVRRSALVNVRAIAALERYGKGTYVVHLRDGTKVISSRYYQPALKHLLRAET